MQQKRNFQKICFLFIFGLLLSSFQIAWASPPGSVDLQFWQNSVFLPGVGDDPNSESQNPEGEIIAYIKKYFEARYQNLIGLKDENYINSFISNDQSEPSWIQLERLRSKTIGKINSSFYLPYEGYEIDLSFSEIRIDGTSATVYLNENALVSFKDPAILPVEFSEISHKMLLIDCGAGWRIITDDYQDVFTFQIEGRSEDEIFSTIERNIVNQKREVEDFSPRDNTASPSNIINLTYNRTAAVNYANTWKNGVNPSFWQEALDCTNFVSQAVYAGTNQVMSTPNDYWNKWYFDSYTKTGSLPWINVGGFYTFLTTNTSRGPVGYSSGSYMCNLSVGDVVVFKWVTTGEWRHAVIVTSFTGSCHDYTKIQVASHTPFGSFNLAYFAPSIWYALSITGYNN